MHKKKSDNLSENKFIVICYAVHDRSIASHDGFPTKELACKFIHQDAQNTYNEEISKMQGNTHTDLFFEEDIDGTYQATLTSYDEYCWTWEIVEI